MPMKLLRFRVTEFRSVDDSGWIDAGPVTALIGTNEAGKTNLLLPLWKLKPAKEGKIHPTADYPRKQYNDIRARPQKPVFITAEFQVEAGFAGELAKLTGAPANQLDLVHVARRFDGTYETTFPKVQQAAPLQPAKLLVLLDAADADIAGTKAEDPPELVDAVRASIASSRTVLATTDALNSESVGQVVALLADVETGSAPKTSMLVPRFDQLRVAVSALAEELGDGGPNKNGKARDAVVAALPSFVYYSNYGNLDAEIYLPHVIENLVRTDLAGVQLAKTRTLKVLFEFVKLEPKEILELGRDFRDPGNPARRPTEAEIGAIAEKKKERTILMDSASAQLTRSFREWWKQGDYRFRFQADGDHFRIWVSDQKRPEEIELENRSTGLQWFLSFYLVFLVESQDAHEGAILLLDEPGLSLHPLAQRDLSAFFEGLSASNQLLYTTHSPFLVDADRLERARKVFVADDGTTRASHDLRASGGDMSQRGAGYAVHAAIGLTVAESLLLGCQPVVVEGPSDQYYLSAIKNVLVATGKVNPGRELVFPPAGGAKGVKVLASVLGTKDEALPFVLMDSDDQGKRMAQALKSDLYAGAADHVLEVGDFVSVERAEVEDLMPADVLVHELDRWQRAAETPFGEGYKSGQAIVPQIEKWAAEQRVALEMGWKVELAKKVKANLLKRTTPLSTEVIERWSKLLIRMSPTAEKKVP